MALLGAVVSTQPPGGLSARQFRNQKAYRVPFVYPQIYSVYSDVLYSSINVSTRESRGLLIFHRSEVKKKMLSNSIILIETSYRYTFLTQFLIHVSVSL